MTTRITSGGFLTCKNKILMMRRGMHKKLGPGHCLICRAISLEKELAMQV